MHDHNPLDTDALVVDFEPMVKKWARIYRNREHEYDDLYQVGMIGLLRGAALYDPSRGTPPGAYYSRWIKGTMLNYMRDTNFVKLTRAEYRDFANRPISKSIFTMVTSDGENGPYDGYADGSVLHPMPADFPYHEIYEGELMQAIVDILPERERKALCMAFLEDKSQREIGREIGFSQMHTGRIIQWAIQGLREHFRVSIEEVA